MPWKRSDAMSEKREFVLLSVQEGVNFSELCREFGVSRSVGLKWKQRFLRDGYLGLEERSRRPKVNPNQVSERTICRIVEYRLQRPTRGAKKIQHYLRKNFSDELVPSIRTINRILSRANLQKNRPNRGKRLRLGEAGLTEGTDCNLVWTADGKGWWRTLDGKRCEPLTIRDEYSKHVHAAEGMESLRYEPVKERFQSCFEEYGLPEVIRTDNGVPFAARRAICGLSKLSVWWLKLGIRVERIPPGKPQLNGGHERMHRDIAEEIEIQPARNLSAQQRILDDWREEFNHERSHEALQDKTPAEVYVPSSRKYSSRNEPEYEYPDHWEIRKIDGNGHLWWRNARIFLSKAFSGEFVALDTSRVCTRIYFCNLLVASTDGMKILPPPPMGGSTKEDI